MQADTIHVTINASKSKIFQYLIDIENLPAWAAPFCQRLDNRNGRYYVTSPFGVLVFDMHSDANTGAIDLRFGPTPDQLVTFPMRVVELDATVSLVAFTAWQIPGMDEAAFAGQLEGIRQELDELKRLVEPC